ncbi:MAG TPA: DUF2147 domain-containing protein [Sediminibacterium sp.]|uniref:DUF2147 domain-containing protein n=1 Tax=Sediminibacterium sp. TaxID=1917865 RepID=UPI0008D85020|nr:DUF2147 domain-containing protein [Sediminibacterium sp.]OHC85103.1 MAG: SIGNAL peptide protein [Sphingobacteriia bacterium RIFOXYC2_FULL_35_18]OHC87151.1 MAG: SIGNAL peptide protein [Sphingobacteriia bacterium RIFOXYD2_FULL_35_12]OYY09526.1 MAG: SIGNAL peptide protein [Sphingobacteriia bacterium 35-36-14]OYZ51474.1 MAG: SIGNAL peptide protein [Sphingobacteriia bacterium 24-36-13]OZA62754.1 MAG: SIGNAL peptide protein [Sphingobacteriia bacterium 39-36-14]
MIRLIKSLMVIFSLVVLQSFLLIQDDSSAIIGVWKTGDGNAMVRIYKNGEKFQGKIVWLKEPNDPETGKPKLDKNHSEEANRTRPILGLVNIWGFSFKEKNIWDEGNIYDPKNGNTYSCTMKLINANTLEVRGFIGVSLIGRTDTWTRQVAK